MKPQKQAQFIQFLREELGLANADLDLALQHPEQQSNLPMILWQYGLIDACQLGRIFDWLESRAGWEPG